MHKILCEWMALLLCSAACAFTIFVFLQGEVLFCLLCSFSLASKKTPVKNTKMETRNLEKTLFLQHIRYVRILALFRCFPLPPYISQAFYFLQPVWHRQGFCKQITLQRCAERGLSSGRLVQGLLHLSVFSCWQLRCIIRVGILTAFLHQVANNLHN